MGKTSKAVLWANVEALMLHKWRRRNVTGFAAFVGVGIGTVQRIEAQSTSVGLEVLDKIAGKFGLEAWQLLVPGLEVTSPPMLARDSAEVKRLLDNVQRSTEALTGALRSGGNSDHGDFDDRPHTPQPKGPKR